MIIQQLLAYILFILHSIFFYLLPVYISLYSHNIKYLLLIIFYWIVVIFNWYLFDNCIITIIEKRLLNNKFTSINKWSTWYIDIIEKKYGTLISKFVFSIIILSPIIFSTIALFRIYSKTKNN